MSLSGSNTPTRLQALSLLKNLRAKGWGDFAPCKSQEAERDTAHAPAVTFAGALTVRGCRNACSLAAMPAVALSAAAAFLAAFPAFLAASAARLASKACARSGQVSRTVLTRRAQMSVVTPFASSLSLSRSCSCTRLVMAVIPAADVTPEHLCPHQGSCYGRLQQYVCFPSPCRQLGPAFGLGQSLGLHMCLRAKHSTDNLPQMWYLACERGLLTCPEPTTVRFQVMR